MTVAVRQEATGFITVAGSVITITPASAYLAGSSLHLVGSCLNNNTITIGGDGVNTFVSFGAAFLYGSTKHLQHWYANNVAAGAPTLTFNLSASTTQWQVYLAEISGTSGLDTSITNAQTAIGSGTDVLTTGNVTPSLQPGLIHALCVNNNSGGYASGTGYTLGISGTDHTASGFYNTESLRYTSLSALAATWSVTQTSNNPGMVAALFAETVPQTQFIQSRKTQLYYI